MKLNDKIQEELLRAIQAAVEKQSSFPIEAMTSGNIKHLIATKQQSSGHFLAAIEYNDQDYLIYLIG